MKQRLINTGTALFLVAAVMAVGAGFFLGRTTAPETQQLVMETPTSSTQLARTGTVVIPENTSSFREIVSDVMPSIVQIGVVDVVEQRVPSNPFGFFFGPRGGGSSDPQSREFRRQGLGSGVVVRKTGDLYYALTNNHVVGDAEEIMVMLSDGRDYDANLVGTDARRDLALISFQTSDDIAVATLGNSESLMPGDWVLAMGSPLGFQSTVTAGIVSAVNRETLPGSNIAGFTDYIQTDAAINQGNSGGALVNMEGEVIGINTWIASPSGGSIGLGFAIPVNNARGAIDDFIVKGRVDYGWLGITAGDIDERIAESLEVGVESGALVHGVFSGSPADKAGIRAGDVITRIGETEIDGSSELVKTVGTLAPGSRVEFSLRRAEERVSVPVRLKSRGTDEDVAELSKRLWPGFNVAAVEDGVVVAAVNPDGPAAGGLQVGDRITRVAGKPVEDLSDFYQALASKKRGEVLFTIRRDESELIIGLVS
jgi:serine protease Do